MPPRIAANLNSSLSSSINSLNLDHSMKPTNALLQVDGNISFSETLSDSECPKDSSFIPVLVTQRLHSSEKLRGCVKNNLKCIKRSKKLLEASRLPVIVTLNPRSLYKKKNEFQTLMEQTEAGICCVSETWDRSHVEKGELISDLITIDGYQWIKNVVQRNRGGGKPAILASTNDYYITELSPSIITVPINVEVAWALLTPKFHDRTTGIRHIAVASVYYSSTLFSL